MSVCELHLSSKINDADDDDDDESQKCVSVVCTFSATKWTFCLRQTSVLQSKAACFQIFLYYFLCVSSILNEFIFRTPCLAKLCVTI